MSDSGTDSSSDADGSWWSRQSDLEKLLFITGVLFVLLVGLVVMTVIGAAVIGTFVLGVGDSPGPDTPSAQFAYDYNSANETLTVTHIGGDSISASRVSLSGNGHSQSWETADGKIEAGDETTLTDVQPGEQVTIEWRAPETGEVFVIASHRIAEDA